MFPLIFQTFISELPEAKRSQLRELAEVRVVKFRAVEDIETSEGEPGKGDRP